LFVIAKERMSFWIIVIEDHSLFSYREQMPEGPSSFDPKGFPALIHP
jgi:hypothetical protein